MCIIVVKNRGLDFPSIETLKQCFNNNSDGAGFMFNGADGRVHIRKGYLTFKSFKKAYEREISEGNISRDSAVVYHFRISTQAGINAQNCHPYPLSKSDKALKSTCISCNIGVAHNGIISLTTDAKNKNTNDTQEFIKQYLCDLVQSVEHAHKLSHVIQALTDFSNRFAIMDGDGNIQLIGDGWTCENDILYSNTSYKPRTYSTKYNYLIDYDDDNEIDDCDGYCEYCKQTTCYYNPKNYDYLFGGDYSATQTALSR